VPSVVEIGGCPDRPYFKAAKVEPFQDRPSAVYLVEGDIMKRTINAVFENGVFRPLQPVGALREHQPVRLAIDDASSSNKQRRFEDLLGGWPLDELDDGFEEFLEQQRR
jgi:predicted DNA-binding antitoxin AbrB/MazE fold protein